nr:MAG TPA: hypothetical protein [Caudoviricetes sp.]
MRIGLVLRLSLRKSKKSVIKNSSLVTAFFDAKKLPNCRGSRRKET